MIWTIPPRLDEVPKTFCRGPSEHNTELLQAAAGIAEPHTSGAAGTVRGSPRRRECDAWEGDVAWTGDRGDRGRIR